MQSGSEIKSPRILTINFDTLEAIGSTAGLLIVLIGLITIVYYLWESNKKAERNAEKLDMILKRDRAGSLAKFVEAPGFSQQDPRKPRISSNTEVSRIIIS